MSNIVEIPFCSILKNMFIKSYTINSQLKIYHNFDDLEFGLD